MIQIGIRFIIIDIKGFNIKILIKHLICHVQYNYDFKYYTM